MEKIRILYRLGESGRNELMYNLAQELQNKIDHEPFFHCGISGFHFLKDKIDQKNLLFMDIGNQTKIKKPDIKFLKNAEEKFDFNIWDIWEIVAQRSKKRRRESEDQVLIQHEYIIKELEHFLDENKITHFVIYGAAASGDIIFFKMMKQKNIKVISLHASALQKRFAIANDLSNNLFKLKENYQEIKDKGFTNQEKDLALELLRAYREKNYKPDCIITHKELKINKIKRYTQAGWSMIKGQKSFPTRFRHLFWKPIQKVYDHLGIFEKPIKGEKFILYPLHHQPEASTLIYGKWYNNQLNLIENLVRSIPVDCKLYVKVHNFGYGNRDIKFYKEISKYSNVRLINPQSNNLDLIKQSSLVITITGTSGWEAIMFQKPVIIFGDIFYDVFDCVKKIEKIRDLPTTIKELLGKKIKYEETLACLTALIRSTYPGFIRLPGDCNGLSLKEENIKLLVDGIYASLQPQVIDEQPAVD